MDDDFPPHQQSRNNKSKIPNVSPHALRYVEVYDCRPFYGKSHQTLKYVLNREPYVDRIQTADIARLPSVGNIDEHDIDGVICDWHDQLLMLVSPLQIRFEVVPWT